MPPSELYRRLVDLRGGDGDALQGDELEAGAVWFHRALAYGYPVVYSLASGAYERLTDSGSLPVWLHQGSKLLYLRESRIFLYDLGAREPRLLLEPPPSSDFTSLALSPDDRTLYTVRSTDEGDVWMVTLKENP